MKNYKSNKTKSLFASPKGIRKRLLFILASLSNHAYFKDKSWDLALPLNLVLPWKLSSFEGFPPMFYHSIQFWIRYSKAGCRLFLGMYGEVGGGFDIVIICIKLKMFHSNW